MNTLGTLGTLIIYMINDGNDCNDGNDIYMMVIIYMMMMMNQRQPQARYTTSDVTGSYINDLRPGADDVGLIGLI